MQVFFRSLLAVAFFGMILLAQPAEAEESDDFNTLNLYFYGDLDNGDGNISTLRPTSDTDTQSDCPQDGNRLSWPGQARQWEDVGSWEVELQTPGEVASGDYTFTIWANSTQGTVEDVQFRIAIYIGYSDNSDAYETSQSKTITDSSEVATRFDINFDISNASFGDPDQSNDERFLIDLEYSGGDPGENPITGGSSTEQIVVLTSSVEHPSGIANLSINHYRAWFSEIGVEEFSERVFIKTIVESAFGKPDIDPGEWMLGVYGLSGNQGLTADFNMKSSQNDTYELSFYWYYNRDNAISDTYNFFIQVMDIQGNYWEVISDEELYLVIHGFEIDNSITSGDITINNQTGTSIVKAGSSFTIDIVVSATGDPLITYNPIPITIVWWVDDSNEIVLYETAVFANPGATAKISFRHTFDKEGDYLIKVIIDRGNFIIESDESNNIGEFILQVSEPDKENIVQSFVDSITGGGIASMLAILSATSILLAFFYLRRSGKSDFDWEEDDEF